MKTRTQAALAAKGAIVRVPIRRHPGVFATLDAEDWQRWIATGHSPALYINDNGTGTYYVRAKRYDVAGGTVNLSREIMQPGVGRVVRYHDGDYLNLTKGNLYVEEGTARGQTPVEIAA